MQHLSRHCLHVCDCFFFTLSPIRLSNPNLSWRLPIHYSLSVDVVVVAELDLPFRCDAATRCSPWASEQLVFLHYDLDRNSHTPSRTLSLRTLQLSLNAFSHKYIHTHTPSWIIHQVLADHLTDLRFYLLCCVRSDTRWQDCLLSFFFVDNLNCISTK